MPGEQVSQHRQHIITRQLALNVDGQALPAVLVDHGQHPERLAVMGAIGDEVVTSDMTVVLGPEPHARAVIQP